MSKKSKKPSVFLRSTIGSHLDRKPRLDPKHPAPKPPGEKRGVGKPFIKIITRSSISYRLAPHGRILTHHEDGPVTISHRIAEWFIRDWIGLNKEDYCSVTKVVHSFPHADTHFNFARNHV